MRIQEAAISNLDDLKTWFMAGKKPYFTIYSGKEPKPSNTITRNHDISDMEEAWNFLEQTLSFYEGSAGNLFKIFAKETPSNAVTAGYNTLFRIPGAVMTTDQNIGIAGMPGMGINGVYGFMQREFEQKLEIADLKRRVEMAENSQIGSMPLTERVIESIIGNEQFVPVIGNIIQAFIGKFMSGTNAGRVAVAYAGSPINEAGATTPKYQGDPTQPRRGPGRPKGTIKNHSNPLQNEIPFMQDSQNEIPQEEEQNRIEVAINRIADALPDVDIEDLMEKLANYVETNPAMAKMMLTNLK